MHEPHWDLDYRMFKLEKYVPDYPWLYFNVIDAGFKWKICEMLPPLSSSGGNTRLKLSNEAVKSFTGHPRHFLDGHQNSFKHSNATNNMKVLFHSIPDSNLASQNIVTFFVISTFMTMYKMCQATSVKLKE